MSIEVKKTIKEIKHLPFKDYGVDCAFGDLKYKLYLLTAECEKDIKLMELLSRWRKENEIWFSAIFKVTTERTMKWFRDQVIGKEDRLSFIIDVDGKFIGHLGLNRFDFNTMICELDNILRGESGQSGIMQSAVEYMMEWGKAALDIKGYKLQVCSTNERALKLYEKLGFAEFKRVPVIRVEKKDRIEFTQAPEARGDEIFKYMIHMKQI